MKYKSKITGSSYEPKDVIFIRNMQQNFAYFNNGADEFLVDIFYDKGQDKNKMVFVYEKNDFMYDLYQKWNNYELSV